ncbi:hypothetical protein PPL_07022 [Heterostelium album PN500]|uniref:F-box domain-containing protein n=1 Tax=Heterostelium pallidum (strain ATCC 26659 / Pp 5 / PN500) TaxID=670386 RepID=D3BE69_HETP5|nr:hypothetical protein PPL_07022 [Heterostelium album PN500]EFA80200.1 hypothetical protein PPL_07022 [Heterostelium album PN500]|eukprot:XP_020432320.1 hypothetical protein PPL_07022 [Heterostelium album PN500]
MSCLIVVSHHCGYLRNIDVYVVNPKNIINNNKSANIDSKNNYQYISSISDSNNRSSNNYTTISQALLLNILPFLLFLFSLCFSITTTMPVLSRKSGRKMSKSANSLDYNHHNNHQHQHHANNNEQPQTQHSHRFFSSIIDFFIKIKPSSSSSSSSSASQSNLATIPLNGNHYAPKRSTSFIVQKEKHQQRSLDSIDTIIDENNNNCNNNNNRKNTSKMNRLLHTLSFHSCGNSSSNHINPHSQTSINLFSHPSSNSNFYNNKKNSSFPLHLLPEELLIKVAMNFSADMIYKVSMVCSDLHRLMQDIGLWRYKVEEKWMPLANQHSLLARGEVNDHLVWKNYYHIRGVLSRKGAVSSMSIRPKGSVPSPRYQHTGTVIGSSIYYVGGQETQLRRFNDIYKFNTETHRFARLEVTGAVPKFARHTAVALGSKIYVFGGFDGSGIYFDLAVFDTDTQIWSNPMVYGNPPRSRTNHASAIVGNKLYVFGGINRDARWELQDLDEFFVFDIATMTWSEVLPTGDLPSARCGHRLVAIDTKLFMFGGGAGDSWRERFNDMHIYDTETNVWRRVPSIPLVRVCTFSSVFVIGNLVGVFGGQHLIKGKVTKKMYFFDTLSESWSKQEFTHSGPNPRDMASADVVGDRIYMFGGYDGRAMDDLNVITISHELKNLLPTIYK